MKKKYIFITILAFVAISYYYLHKSIGTNNSFLSKINQFIPNEVRLFLKETLFVFNNQKKLKKEIKKLKKDLAKAYSENNEILNKIELFNFSQTSETNFKSNDFTYEEYENLVLYKLGNRTYFEEFENNFFAITGNGTLLYSPIDKLNGKNFNLKKINSNFLSKLEKENSDVSVTGVLVKKNKMYLSYSALKKENCHINAIVYGEINFEKINFKEFFSTNECSPSYTLSTGGALSNYKDNKILITIGDWEHPEQFKKNSPQNLKNLKGKIISINEETKAYEIISLGHRNQQGVFYDSKNDIIFSTEHGPQGGDEININISPDSKNPKNYGWPISSYGEHYGYPDNEELHHKCKCPIREVYEAAPLNKSHKDFGFIEPLKNFTPSIGITQIIKTEDFINKEDKNIIYVASLGYDISEGDLSIHQLILSSKFEIEEHNIIPIGKRIRDIIYLKNINKILLSLNGSIGILGLNL